MKDRLFPGARPISKKARINGIVTSKRGTRPWRVRPTTPNSTPRRNTHPRILRTDHIVHVAIRRVHEPYRMPRTVLRRLS